MRLFYFVQAKTLCRYGCMYLLAALVCVCAADMVCILVVCAKADSMSFVNCVQQLSCRW